jgi:DNA-binding LytR/AlgR family response regulator
LNGLDLARTIRRKDESLAIIFVTGYPDYMDEGYDVAALHYLLKPVRSEKLFACLDRANRKTREELFLLVECNGEIVRLPQKDIICIEAFAHEVKITTVDKTYMSPQGIGSLDRELDHSLFMRPHRSYIAGLRYVRQIGKSELIFDDGTRIPISRHRYEETNGAFIDYYRSKNI